MTRRVIRTVIALATLSIAGIVLIQIFWMQKAFDLKEREFSDRVNIALRSVAKEIMIMSNDSSDIEPVSQLSSNYFVVGVNDTLHPYLLESLLRNQFDSRNIRTSFEYTIYDCFTDSLVFGNLVTFTDEKAEPERPEDLPRFDDESHYFGVYFPEKESYIIGQMGIWVFSSAILMLVILFFGYTLRVILKQKRLSEIRNDFINNMTHEFKTPVSSITSSSEMLLSGALDSDDERKQRYYKVINDESHRLKMQVDKVLQMAEFDKDELELSLAEVDVHQLINKTLTSIELQLESKNGRILTELKADRPVIQADPLHLSNIIHNLLDNAVKYCKRNPEITISTSNTSNGIEIKFRDNGIGIPANMRSDVFTRFFRVPTGDVHDVKGFGLGLYYVKTMVEVHRGTIKVDSNHGGSTFTIKLPAKQK